MSAMHPPRIVLATALVTLGVCVAVVALLVRYDAIGSSSSSGISGSGIPAVEARHVTGFREVELRGSVQVTVRAGAPRAIVVHADDNLVRLVRTTVVGDRLVVATKDVSFESESPMVVVVHVPVLAALVLSGSGILAADDVSAPKLVVVLSGSGVLRAGGRAQRLEATLSGSGDAQLAALTSARARALVSGSGRIVLVATDALDAAVTGSGAILYGGSPAELRTSVTGSGAVIPAVA